MSSKQFYPFKDFQSNQIQRSSRKIFTAHYACRNADLNLTLFTGTTYGFIFQIINSLTESWGYAWPALTVTGCYCHLVIIDCPLIIEMANVVIRRILGKVFKSVSKVLLVGSLVSCDGHSEKTNGANMELIMTGYRVNEEKERYDWFSCDWPTKEFTQKFPELKLLCFLWKLCR